MEYGDSWTDFHAHAMATTALKADSHPPIAAETVEASLWWEPFVGILAERPFDSALNQSLETKIKECRNWFLDSISQFKTPNQRSREALDSPRIKIGEHELVVIQELKDAALEISSMLCLDEVQSYILVKRSVESNSSEVDEDQSNLLNSVVLDYFTERQCLLESIGMILVHSYEGQSLVNDGLAGKLISIFEDLLSWGYPVNIDTDLRILWAEKMLDEEQLILDNVLLINHETMSVYDVQCWKRLCFIFEGTVNELYNFQELAVTPKAICAVCHIQVQLQLILIDALNLGKLLQMINDNLPFSQGSIGFSVSDIQHMDVIMSSFNVCMNNGTGPLILSWAVFLSLISSLPENEEILPIMELDHFCYARQGLKVSSLEFIFTILKSKIVGYSYDFVPTAYRSVLRTLISGLMTSYEIGLKFEDDNFEIIVKILIEIYRNEESFCSQFWDRDSFIDDPVRRLLCKLGDEFPHRDFELATLLSAVSVGEWPSECVFNFIDKHVGISAELCRDSVTDAASDVVETIHLLHIPGLECLVIPSKTRGKVLRMNKNNVVVHLECKESGVLLLLCCLAQEAYMKNLDKLIYILDLLRPLVVSSWAVCHTLMVARNFLHGESSTIEVAASYVCIDVIEIICALLRNLSASVKGTLVMSKGIYILGAMLICLPSRVTAVAMKDNILFDIAFRKSPLDVVLNSLSSGSLLISGRLAKMLLIDREESDCSMTLAVLYFTSHLLDARSQNDTAVALVTFSLKYVLVNHEFWKYKMKCQRWKMTHEVLVVIEKCVTSDLLCPKLLEDVQDIILCDSSVLSALLRIICTTTPTLKKLYVSGLLGTYEIAEMQLAISYGLNVLGRMISSLTKDSPGFAVFRNAILSPFTKPAPVVTAAISLISYFQDPEIQIEAAGLLCALFVANFSWGHVYGNATFVLNDVQVASFRITTQRILSDQSSWNEDLVMAILNLLAAAANYERAFLKSVIMPNQNSGALAYDRNSEHRTNKIGSGLSNSTEECMLSAILLRMEKFEDLYHRNPIMLVHISNFLNALCLGASQWLRTLEQLNASDNFWRLLIYSVSVLTDDHYTSSDKSTGEVLDGINLRYYILSNTLDILCGQISLLKKLIHAKPVANQVSKRPANETEEIGDSKFNIDSSPGRLKEIISSWCRSSVLSDIIKGCSHWEYDLRSHLHAKVASSLFVVHAMLKIRSGDSGSLALSLVEAINSLADKLRRLPVFSKLLIQYAERGYSLDRELENLILRDLFHHIQGELEGRQIENTDFKQLMQFLLDSKFLDSYKYKDYALSSRIKDVYVYDIVRLRYHLGLEMWDLCRWKESKEVAETMLLHLKEENSRIDHLVSKLAVLRRLMALLYMMEADVNFKFFELENDGSLTILKMSSCIDHICQSLLAIVESLDRVSDVIGYVLDIFEAQADLLLLLLRIFRNNSSPTSNIHVLRTSGYCLEVLYHCRLSVSTRVAVKILLMLIVTSTELTNKDLHSTVTAQIESSVSSVEEASSVLRLLPILCSSIEIPDHLTVSLAALDLVMKGFSTNSTWFPNLRRHLPLQLIVDKLQDSTSASVILKFLISFARVQEAELLLNVGILDNLSVLLGKYSDGGSFIVKDNDADCSNISDNTKNSQPVWQLSLAVLTAIVQSSGDNSCASSIVDYQMASILPEKVPLISHIPDFSLDGHGSKRACALKSCISLDELKEIQSTWTLVCIIARDCNSWKRASMESLIAKSIYLLSLMSKARATHCPGALHIRDAPLSCHLVLEEEFERFKEPSFISNQNGCENLDSTQGTRLSDMIAVEIYKTTFLLLKCLCVLAGSVAQKAVGLGFIDLATFPALPMPDILHVLQDQWIVKITELLGSNQMKTVSRETQGVCEILLDMTVMSLYLELSVIQICGLSPVVGRIEMFSTAVGLLVPATEDHVFLREPLTQILSLVLHISSHQEA